jgi:leucyl-tRNA synthetase
MNALSDAEPLDKNVRPAPLAEIFDLFTRVLSPFAPHLAEEFWEMLGHSGGITRAGWPSYRPDLAAEEQFEVVIQVNGKLKGKIVVSDGTGEDEVLRLALAEPKVAETLNGKKVVKKIVVPNKLVNLVVQ